MGGFSAGFSAGFDIAAPAAVTDYDDDPGGGVW
jgi:hypothetical protein